MSDSILVLNAGSSSIKFQLLEAGGDLVARMRGKIDGIGTPHARLSVENSEGRKIVNCGLEQAAAADVDTAQATLGDWLVRHGGGLPRAVGHRVVHGGRDFTTPALIDDSVLEQLDALIPLAPLHQPHNLAPIRSIRARRPELPQVACFDTAFHRGHPDLAERFAVPECLYDRGIRRYGFHGISYEFVAGRFREMAPGIAGGRVIIAHLGSGTSACAIVDGRSVDSTMSFTPLDGLPMGTRPGQLDPGIVLYLQQQGMGATELEHLLYHECGLKGLSGLSSDVRDLLASGSPGARLALDYFAYHTARAFSSLASSMGGLEAIVFTAGVGENAAPVRENIVRRCGWMGVELDPERNAAHGPLISADQSRVPVFVIPTNEERMIAQHTIAVIGAVFEPNDLD